MNPTSADRLGAITAAGLTFPVTQSGDPVVGAPTLNPPQNPCESVQLKRNGEQVASIGISGGGRLPVRADALCRWTVQSTVPWLAVTGGEVRRVIATAASTLDARLSAIHVA